MNDWLVFGFIGEAAFAARFVVQWAYSEHRRRSVIPMAFWYLSIVGSLILLAYAMYLRDPVFIASQFGGLLIYARNIQLRRREEKLSTADSGEQR